ncbi:MAG: hypothetical protein ACPGNT_10060 [Rhodospirillales bacterium]
MAALVGFGLGGCSALETANSVASTVGLGAKDLASKYGLAAKDLASEYGLKAYEPAAKIGSQVWAPTREVGTKLAPYVNSASPWARDTSLIAASSWLDQPSAYWAKGLQGCRRYAVTDPDRAERCEARLVGPRSYHW